MVNNRYILTEPRNERDIVFGGDYLDEFASNFNDYKWKIISQKVVEST